MAMLEVKDLNVYYGMIQAIKGISFEVNQGEVIALIGANGAGKTTTLHAVTGLTRGEDQGHVISSKARILQRVPAHKIVGLWEWRTFRRDAACLHSSVSIRT